MYLTYESIQANEFLKASEDYASGASVLFLGMVRDHSEGRNPMIPAHSQELDAPVFAGRKVLYLEYEAYEEMAERLLQELIQRAFAAWPLEEVRLLHRLGRVELGEIAVAIDVRSAHRDEAYQASRFLIEEIKHKVPIWKKEYFADGTSEWSKCAGHGLYADVPTSA